MTHPGGRPMSEAGLAEEERCEQLAFDFEYSQHLTLVRTVNAHSGHLVRHDAWERDAYLRMERALDQADVRSAKEILQDLRQADRYENARHRLLHEAVSA